MLHNACLRMEATGPGVGEVLTPRGIHRWLGRSGLAVGGAASLAIGAIIGGALEAVPVLLPPAAAAATSPRIVTGADAGSPWALAADSLAVAATKAQGTAAAAVAAASNGTSGVNGSGSLPGGPKPCSTCITWGPIPVGPTGPTPISSPPAGGTLPGGGTPSTPPPGGGGSLLDTVTQTVSGTVGTVSGVVGGVAGTTTTIVSGTTSGTSGSTSTSTSGTTGTVSGVVSGTTQTLSGTTSTLTSGL